MKETGLKIDDGGAGGIPVVFVHSFAGNISHWAAQLEHLRPERRAIAFDLRGHGGSPVAAAREKYTVRMLARDIDQVVGSLKLQRFILVGHSMGAAVATAYAGANPDNVAGLLLVDPAPKPGAIPAEQVTQIVSALEADPVPTIEQYWKSSLFAGSSRETQDRLLQDLRTLTRPVMVDLTKDVFRYDAAVDLARYPGPKLTVVTPLNDAPMSLHNAVPDVAHVMVTGTGHWIQLDDPEEMNRILDDFLRRVSQAIQ